MRRNINEWERVASVTVGGVLLLFGALQPRVRRLAATAGIGLIARGVSGFCPISAAIGRDSRLSDTRIALGGPRGVHVYERITIFRPAIELFRFWRDFSNLPRFMEHLEDVTMLSPTRSVWTARGPAGLSVKWQAKVINEIEGELIGWRSTEHADVATAGSVRFVPTSDGGTELIVHLQYEPPAGKLGAWVASLFGEEPSQQIRDDLRRLKVLLDADSRSRGSLVLPRGAR